MTKATNLSVNMNKLLVSSTIDKYCPKFYCKSLQLFLSEETGYLTQLGVDGRIIVKRSLENQIVKM